MYITKYLLVAGVYIYVLVYNCILMYVLLRLRFVSIKNLIDEKELKLSLALINKVKIPSPPQILMDLKAELTLETPNIKKVIDWISQDIGLASSVLKNINSPLYGIKEEISSIEQDTL